MKKYLREIFISLIIIVLGLMACELCVRFFFKQEIDKEYLTEKRERSRIGPYIQRSKYPDLFYELRPSFNTIWCGRKVFIDENGCRSGSSNYRRNNKAKYKIAVIGDSTSFGWGVSFENTYAERLKSQLEHYLNDKVELRNYSVPGYNTYQESICIEKKIIPWKPNLIILQYDHNDPDPARTVTSGFLEPEYGDNLFHSALVKLIKRRIKLKQNYNLEIFKQDNNQKVAYHNYRIAGPLYEKHKQAMLKIKNDCQRNNIKLLVMIFDGNLKNEIAFSNDHYVMLHEKLVEFFNRSSINCFDLYPEYQKMMNKRKWQDLSPFWLSKKYFDLHPNESGHKFISDKLYDYIILRRVL